MNIDKGIVYRSTGSWYVVKLENGDFIETRIKGKFRTKNLKTTNPIAVGDKVGIHIQADGKGLIEEIFPRMNYMIRKSVNLSKEAHIIGSNIHVCILVATLNNPYTSTGFIDRFSVTSQAYDIPLIIVFNKADLYNEIWQAFAVLLPVQTVGVMGDERTYDFVCALRAVTSLDGMTADYYPFEQEFLANVSTRIINEVKGINRVVYDITSKPPGTIEWE